MESIASPSKTKEILERFGFSFKKKFGQNFLIDENVVRKIVRLSGVTKDDSVLEIGPGIGTMTQILSEEAGAVTAVEIDNKLIEVLTFTLNDCKNVNVINEDILKCNLEELSENFGKGRPFKVVANLPYYITTPIIMALLEENVRCNNNLIESLTVMIQKEVAQRISAKPGSKDYGVLTLASEYYTKPELLMSVPASVFIPRPNVDSAVIRLDVLPEPTVSVQEEGFLFKLIKAGFAQRRKTFVNSVSAMLGTDKALLKEALLGIKRDENIRGETLSLEEYAKLSDILSSRI